MQFPPSGGQGGVIELCFSQLTSNHQSLYVGPAICRAACPVGCRNKFGMTKQKEQRP